MRRYAFRGSMKHFLLVILSIFCCKSFATIEDQCNFKNGVHGKIFELNIKTSFHGQYKFEFCQSKSETYLSVTTTKIETIDSEDTLLEIKKLKEIEVSEQKLIKIMNMLEIALRYNKYDDVIGIDGSTWCLETQQGNTYSKACFFSPIGSSKERGLQGVELLGKYMWQLAGLEKQIQLY